MKKKTLLLILLMTLLAPWAVAQQSLPYSYGFEDNDLSADGWELTASNTSTGIKTSNVHTGTYGFTFDYSTVSSTDAYLMSPILTGGDNGVNVSFYAMARSSSYLDHFQIGYTTDATVTDPSAFTYGSLITSTTSWKEYTAECPAKTVRVAIKYDTDNYNDGWDLYLDDFTFEPGASCKTPTDLTATNLTTESATLGWTAPDPAPDNGYNVRYRTAQVDNPYYFDDFETNTLTGWTVYTDGEAPQSEGWYTYQPSGDLGTAHSGSYCASAWSWTNDVAYAADNWLISPEVPLTGTLRFYVRTNQDYPDEYEVLLSSTGTDEADFDVTLQAMAAAPATGEWAEVSISLKSYSGNGYIAIHHVSDDCNYLLIDDFGIFDEPTPAGAWTNTTSNTNSKDIAGLTESTLYDFEVQSNCGGETSDWVASTFKTNASCMPVADLAVSDATTTTISLTWTDQNNGSASYIITDGDDNAVTVTNLTTTGCTIIELKANTAYTFKVTADCGSTTETINVRTECDALSTIPYNEGFEASSEIIYCWDLDNFGRVNNSSYAHTGSVALYSQTSSVGYAILPATATNISDLMLNFWWSNYYSGYNLGYLEVGYITDINDYTTFVNVGTIDMSVSYDEYIHTDDFVFTGAPAGARIALSYTKGSGGSLVLIDDLTLEYKPACMRPTDLVVTDPTGHGATFAWTDGGSIGEDGWQLYFSEDGSAISTGYEYPDDVIDADTNPFTVTSGLKPETDYYVWVRSHCEYTGYSPWSNPATFTTTEACPAPTGLAASEITGNTAKLSWTGTSESYTVKYRTAAYMDAPVLEEDFSAAPSGWLFRTGALNNDGTATLSGTSSWTRSTSNGVFDTHIYMNLYNTKNYWLITPSMTIADGYVMNMDIAYTPYSNSNPLATGCTTHRFAILISTDDMATWTILREWNNSGSPYVLDNVSQTGENTGNIDLSAYAGETAYIAFFGHSETTSYDNNFHFDNVVIGTSVPAGAWQTKNTDASPYTITGLTAETYYEAKVQGNCGSEGTSDETASIFFTTSAACPEQDALVASNIQIHSAVISWDAHGADEWNLRYSNDNGTTWTEITKAITNPYTLEELNAATDYLVQVQAKCAASDEWSASVAFTTKCDFITTFPWSEDFESYSTGNFNETCWVNEHIAGTASDVFQVTTSSAGTNTTKKLYLPDEQDGNMIKLVLPGMTLPNSNYAFYIDVYRSDNTYSASYAEEGIRVFASADGNIEGATELAFIPRQYNVGNTEIPEETEVGWYTYMLPINMSGNCYIILRGESKWCTGTYMDNFMVTACAPVGTLSYDNLASQTVDLHWTLLDDTQDAWQVCINGDETHPIDITESDVVVEGVERTYSMAGLTAETPYTVKVRANCGSGDFGAWSNTVNFTTFAACATPIDLATSNLTMVGADLAWTGSSDVDYYTVQYRTAAYIDTPVMEEDFSAAPSGWLFRTGVLNTDGTATLSGTSSWNRGTSNSVLDGQHMYMNMYSTKNWWLITPSMTIADGYVMNMDIAYTPYSNSNPLATGCTTHRFAILISTDDMATWTILREWNNSGSPYVLDNVSQTGENTGNIDLSAYAGETAYIAFFGHSEVSNYDNNFHFDNVSIGSTNAAGSWQTAANDVTTWNYTLEGLTANVKYDARVYANCATDPDTENDMTTFTTLEEHNIVFPETGNWAAGNFEPTGAPTIDDDVIIRANVTVPNGTNALANNIILQNGSVITVAAGATLTINGSVTNGGNNKIIIEDGGQLIHHNSLNATVKKNITAPAVWKGTSDADGWYLIATPTSSGVTIASIFEGTIDLFKYDEATAYWWSYNNGSHTFNSMTRGTGYLHASQTSQTVSYAGSMMSTESSESISLSYACSVSDDMKGFNLIGNPFTRNLVLGDMSIGSNPVTTIYVIKDEDRTKLTAVTTDEYEVKPGEGFFVQATALNQMVKLNPSAKDEFEFRYIKIVAGNENGYDNAFIQLEYGNTLNKMNIANKTSVYVVDGGENLAATTINELAGSMPVNFKATAEDVYTITINAKNLEANTMILLDNMTGEEIDLLATPSYSFKATPNDSEDRFRLIFDCNTYTGIDEYFTDDIFAFQSGNEIYVKGEGTLEVFDVMGRMVLNTRINGVERVNVPANAVYIFKLEEKTQKIVVR